MGLEFKPFALAGARKAADEIEANVGPTEGRIRIALKTFSVGQWISIIKKFEREDREVLRKFILANLAELEQTLALDKLRAIRGAIGMHTAETVLGQTLVVDKHGVIRGAIDRHAAETGLQATSSREWVRVTDAHWASVLYDIAWCHYKALDPSPPGTRSWADMTRPKAIAEKLGISRYRTANMLRRMQEKSLHEFIAEHGGDFLDYWMWATDPRAYERRRKSTD